MDGGLPYPVPVACLRRGREAWDRDEEIWRQMEGERSERIEGEGETGRRREGEGEEDGGRSE